MINIGSPTTRRHASIKINIPITPTAMSNGV